jgi:N-acetyl-anhydromuramyl-L-alanine amidase AmpD
MRNRLLRTLVSGGAGLALAALPATAAPTATARSATLTGAITAAADRYGVPAPVLTSICYLEGRLSDHGGAPSADGGYGCMHLVRNAHSDTLDQAARLTGTPVATLRTDRTANLAGAAAVLRADAVALSPRHAAPASLAGWYGAVAQYSGAGTRSVATLYADQVYKIINAGLSAATPDGEAVRLAPTAVRPDTASAAGLRITAAVPSGCTTGGTDYPNAVNCIVPTTFDCNTGASPCTYDSANRPSDLPVLLVTIHDTEESLAATLTTFQTASNGVSTHYVVDTDGTIYQTLHDKDVGFQNGNFWYNQRSIGVEHVGVDASGYQWYNATEYLGSARLMAYLLPKFGIPLDHDHLMSHGTTPSPTLGTSPNHVDPGPYWLWSYYLTLIHQQGVAWPSATTPAGVIRLDPASGQSPAGSGGAETSANFTFFYLYTSASTASAKIPRKGSASDITDETDNVETMLSYPVVAQQADAAGTGDTMYEIWYGEETSSSSYTATGKLAWLAVPPGGAVQGTGRVVTMAAGKKNLNVYGEPTSSNSYVIGATPPGSVYDSPFTLTVSGTVWYCLNYNHRQEWVPASEVASTRTT